MLLETCSVGMALGDLLRPPEISSSCGGESDNYCLQRCDSMQSDKNLRTLPRNGSTYSFFYPKMNVPGSPKVIMISTRPHSRSHYLSKMGGWVQWKFLKWGEGGANRDHSVFSCKHSSHQHGLKACTMYGRSVCIVENNEAVRSLSALNYQVKFLKTFMHKS